MPHSCEEQGAPIDVPADVKTEAHTHQPNLEDALGNKGQEWGAAFLEVSLSA